VGGGVGGVGTLLGPEGTTTGLPLLAGGPVVVSSGGFTARVYTAWCCSAVGGPGCRGLVCPVGLWGSWGV
jgi:hypothetical protein